MLQRRKVAQTINNAHGQAALVADLRLCSNFTVIASVSEAILLLSLVITSVSEVILLDAIKIAAGFSSPRNDHYRHYEE